MARASTRPAPSTAVSDSSATSRPSVALWFLVSSFVVLWDVGFCFMRPRSFPGGDLAWIWEPYAHYINVDLVYGLKSYETRYGFTNAQSFMNIVESALNFAYLYKTWVDPSEVAPLIGFTAVVMTVSKTVLYGLNDYFCGWCMSGQNDTRTLIIFYLFPNSQWILWPSVIGFLLGGDIVRSLRVAARKEKTS